MKLFLSVFFFAASYALSEGIIVEYTYHNATALDWNQAQGYCKTFYKDLATITNISQQQKIDQLGYPPASGWIGFHKTHRNPDTWEWSDDTAVSITYWSSGSPASGPTFNCCSVWQGRWYNEYCGYTHAYFCYRYLILVNQSKTWEEALHFCTTNYTGLAPLPMATQVLQAQKELALSLTANVWTGLRFMDRKWFWMNLEPLETPVSLPSCPARPYHCGAFNTNTNAWENRNCNEKLNFLCWK